MNQVFSLFLGIAAFIIAGVDVVLIRRERSLPSHWAIAIVLHVSPLSLLFTTLNISTASKLLVTQATITVVVLLVGALYVYAIRRQDYIRASIPCEAPQNDAN